MAYTIDDIARDMAYGLLRGQLSADQRRPVLQRLPPEERMAGMTPDERLRGLKPWEIRYLRDKLNATR
ncbi:hypothetical protein [Pararhodospirillum photometricum]|nr:hypothetical protein [Pararhodospirillum photometricum]